VFWEASVGTHEESSASLPEMDLCVAGSAQGDQILFGIVAVQTARLHVMNLEIT
jgi:hypothetical protein